jgi:hypothetical protein
MSARHSSYRKLKKILRHYEGGETVNLDMLTSAQQGRLIFWALMIEASR